MDILQKCARVLWKRESERAAHCDDVLGAVRGQAIKPTMDPFEDHREMWIGDARAVIDALAEGVTDEMVLAFWNNENFQGDSRITRDKSCIAAAIRAAKEGK